jgi:predicted PurR-regulated permease PerM
VPPGAEASAAGRAAAQPGRTRRHRTSRLGTVTTDTTPPEPAPQVPASTAPGSIALLAITAVALVLCYLIARPFVTSLAWATALAVLGAPIQRRLSRSIRSPTLSTTCTVAILAVVLMVPGGLLVPGIIGEAVDGYRAVRAQIETGAWESTLGRHPWIQSAWAWLAQRVDLRDLVQHAGTLLTSTARFAITTSFVGLVEWALVWLFLFYFLRDRDALLAGLRTLLPLDAAEFERVRRTGSDTIIATLYGKVLVGVVQGVLGGLMFWWLDLPAAWFWALVMAILSVLPILGPSLVWLPAGLFLLLDGAWVQAIVLVVWGAAVVGIADNLLYPGVVGRYLHMHTVPLLIAMIGGVIVFGAVGFFVGPVVLAVTIALLEVWRARRSGVAPTR